MSVISFKLFEWHSFIRFCISTISVSVTNARPNSVYVNDFIKFIQNCPVFESLNNYCYYLGYLRMKPMAIRDIANGATVSTWSISNFKYCVDLNTTGTWLSLNLEG